MALDQLLPDYVGNAQRAYDQGKQRKQADIEQQKSDLGELAGYLLSVPEEQRAAVWQSQVAPRVEKLIPGAGREPYGPHVADIAQWAVQEYGKQQQQPARWQNLGNGYVMDGQGNVKQAFEPPKPQAKSRAHPINVPDGSGGYQMMMFDPDTQQVSPMNFGGQQQQAPQQPQERVQFDFAPGTSPEVQAATRAAAGAAQPGAQEVSGFAPAPSGGSSQRMGYRPPPSKTQAGNYRTMSAAEVKSLGLPVGTVAQVGPSGQVQIINKPKDLPVGGTVTTNDDGTTTFTPSGKLSDAQRNNAGFYDRMVNSRKELDALEQKGYDPTNLRDYATVGGKVLNGVASSEGQQYHQAAQNWVRANLRKESGAAIGVAEMDQEIRNYFPVFGDSPEVVKQKANNRKVVENAMRTAAGGAVAPDAKPAPNSAGSVDDLLTKYGAH